MPYKMKTVAPIKDKMAAFRSKADGMDAIKKDKKKFTAAKGELDDLGKELSAELLKIIEAVAKDFNLCCKVIDEKVSEAGEHARLVKERSNAFDKNPDPKLLEGLTSPNLADVILRLQKECKDEQDEFGKSWFEIRGLTATGASKTLPGPDFKPYNVKFSAKRAELMGRSKEYVGRVDGLEAMADEARFLIGEMLADAFTHKSEGGMSKDAAEEYVGEIGDKVRSWDKSAKEDFAKGLKSVENFINNAPKMEDEKDVQVLQSAYRDFVATVKMIGARAKVFETMQKKAAKRCQGISEKADRELQSMADILSTWPKYIQSAVRKAQELMVAANDLQKKVDKIAA